MPANSFAGSPIARITASLAISSRLVFRLTLPGSVLMSANTSGPSPSPPGSSRASAMSAAIHAATSAGIRAEIRRVRAVSAWRSAEPMIRPIRFAVGGSISSSRQCPRNSSRTRSG